MATHSSVLACKIPWTEEPGRLLSLGFAKSRTRLSKWAYESKGTSLVKHQDWPKALWLINDRTEPWTWTSGSKSISPTFLSGLAWRWRAITIYTVLHYFQLSLTGIDTFHNLRFEKSSIFRKDSSEKPAARGISDRQIQDKILKSEGTAILRLLWKIMESLSLLLMTSASGNLISGAWWELSFSQCWNFSHSSSDFHSCWGELNITNVLAKIITHSHKLS